MPSSRAGYVDVPNIAAPPAADGIMTLPHLVASGEAAKAVAMGASRRRELVGDGGHGRPGRGGCYLGVGVEGRGGVCQAARLNAGAACQGGERG